MIGVDEMKAGIERLQRRIAATARWVEYLDKHEACTCGATLAAHEGSGVDFVTRHEPCVEAIPLAEEELEIESVASEFLQLRGIRPVYKDELIHAMLRVHNRAVAENRRRCYRTGESCAPELKGTSKVCACIACETTRLVAKLERSATYGKGTALPEANPSGVLFFRHERTGELIAQRPDSSMVPASALLPAEAVAAICNTFAASVTRSRSEP